MADFIDSVVSRESGGRPYIGWGETDLTPYIKAGKVTRYGFPDWPGKPGPQGNSTAAGLYQITGTNWAKYAPQVGVSDFTPESQRKVAEAVYRDQGPAAWAASEPRRAEGYYGGALHLNVGGKEGAGQNAPPGSGMDLIAGLLAMAQKPVAEESVQSPTGSPLLDRLVSDALGSPQTRETPKPPPGSEADIPPAPAPPLAPENAFETPPAVPGLQPLPQGGGEPVKPAAAPPGAQAALPAAPSPGTALLDKLSAGAAQLPVVEPGQMPAMPASGGELLSKLLRVGDPEAAGAVASSQAMQPAVEGGLPAATGMTPALEQSAALDKPYRSGMKAGEMMSGEALDNPMMGAFGPGIAGSMKGASKAIQEVFSPTTVSPLSQAGEAIMRRERGMAERRMAEADAALDPYRPLVANHLPEFRQYMAERATGAAPATKPKILNFLDFVESRGSGAGYAGPAELRPLADTLRRIYRERRAAIEAEPSTTGASFIDDYYSHMWSETGRARTLMTGGPTRQGSGAPLHERRIPTISEGIDRGLTPASLDPVEVTMRYVVNMERYLAHNRIFRISHDAGMIKYHPKGKQPEGWAQLTGRLATKADMQAYAPEEFARIYNANLAGGFFEGKLGGNIYTAALAAKNAISQTLFSLSGFHAMAMLQEASASAVANAIGKLTDGELAAAAKQLGLGGIPVVKGVADTLNLGKKVQRQYMRVQDYGPDMEDIARLYAGAGGRAVGRGAEWRGTTAENYVKAWRRAGTTIGAKLGNMAHDIGGQVKGPGSAILTTAREMARIAETVTAPLFDIMIPRLKAAAFHDEMAAWLKAHPTASYDEQLTQARGLVDAVDDRFGEMVMDNIFWGKRVKQTLQLLSTSLGWELGSLRAGGGGIMDAARLQWTPRVRYLIGLGSAIATYNASYQYLKTGKTPGEGIGGLLSAGGALDIKAPRTGGVTPEGAYERAMLPGYEKDIIGYWHDPLGEFAGKLSPFARLGVDALTGRDYFGNTIAPQDRYSMEWLKAYGEHVASAFMPIPLKQDRYRGSNISEPERFMGIRPTPEYVQNPQRFDEQDTKRRINALRGEIYGLARHGARTTQDRDSVREQIKEKTEAMRELQKTLGERTKDRAPSQYLYRPDRHVSPVGP